MAGRATRFRGRTFAKSDRQAVWLGIDIDPVTIAAGATVLVATLNAAALALRPFTVVRTRAMINWGSDQAAASEAPLGALGLIVVSDQAAAAGSGSVPSPVGNTDAPFFVWEPLISTFLFGDLTGFIEPSGYNLVVDSKAMRKVGVNEDVAIQVGNTSSAEGAIAVMIGRMLVKLH